jgi:hypothetical protein
MRINNGNPLDKYNSKGKTISKSFHHNDLWIIEHNDKQGGFHTVSASYETIQVLHPPDTLQRKQHLTKAA